MIARTSDFKDEISKLARQIDFKLNLYMNDKLITQDGKFIMTEANNHLIVEQFDTTEVDETLSGDSIFNVTVSNVGTMLSTMMKEIDFEIREELRIGDIVDCNFGLKINKYSETTDTEYQDEKDYYKLENDIYVLLIKGTDYNVGDEIENTIYEFTPEYEWINYGKYIIHTKEYNEDTQTYSYVSYDSMLLSMIMLDDRSLVENVSVKTAIENICNKVGLSVNITAQDEIDLPNLSKVIHQDTFKDIEMTYRDVLDMICQCLGISMISNNKVLYLKRFNKTAVDSFDENYLKDTNVTFGQKYGPINSVVLSRSEDNDNLYRKDDESIALYGLHEFKIKDNLIMLYDDREDYINEIFDELHNIEYYENDFASTGITYLEWLDFYNITRGDKTYNCLMLNDEIKINQGLEEHIYTETPEEATTNYKTAGKTDKEVSFIVDKQQGEIKSRVSQGELESVVEQTASAIGLSVSQFEDGDKVSGATILAQINDDDSQVQIDADKINLNGVVTANNNFKILSDGSMEAKNVKLTGGNVDISSTDSNTYNLVLSGTTQGISNTLKINPRGISFGNSSTNTWCTIWFQNDDDISVQLSSPSDNRFIFFTIGHHYTPEIEVTEGSNSTYITPGLIKLNKNGSQKIISGDN